MGCDGDGIAIWAEPACRSATSACPRNCAKKSHRHPARWHAHDCIQQPPLLNEGRMAMLKLAQLGRLLGRRLLLCVARPPSYCSCRLQIAVVDVPAAAAAAPRNSGCCNSGCCFCTTWSCCSEWSRLCSDLLRVHLPCCCCLLPCGCGALCARDSLRRHDAGRGHGALGLQLH